MARLLGSLLLILALMLSVSFCAEPAPKAKAAPKAEAKPKSATVDTLVLDARLVEIAGKFAPNDLYNYVYMMKYRVVKVAKGSYAGKEILVGHYNPRIPRGQVKDKMAAFAQGTVEKFEQGQVHRLTLITPISLVWNDAVEDEYFDSELAKYFALKADLVK